MVASAATNDFVINVIGLTATGKVFGTGDYITIAGQMYEVVADAVASGGASLVAVNKQIRSTIAPGTPIEYRNPYCEMRLISDSFSVDIRRVVSSGSLDLREAF